MAQQRRRGAGCEGVACEHMLGEQPLHVYGYLWAKPPVPTRRGGGTCADGADAVVEHEDSRFRVVVTDTVVFKHQRPVKWVFSSKQDKGRILCKSRKSLSVGQVVREFLVPKLSTRGTVRDDAELVLATFAYTERCAATGELQLIVEHLDQAGLLALQNRDKPVVSVLQRFVPTKSGYNHMLQAVFTHETCVIRKCVNASLVTDSALSVTQRTITFEADETALRTRDVTNKELQDSIEQINLEFSAHLEKIVGKEIVRHVAYFKVGADDRIYFLWSAMVSFERPGKTNCPVCNELFPRSDVDFLMTYKTIISHAENELSRVRGRDGQAPVPAIMLKIYGPMKKKRFEELKEDTAFLMERKAKAMGAAQRPKARPFSADIPRIRFQRNASKSTHSSKQYLRHLTQLLPVVVQAKTSKAESKDTLYDCLERVARHLQRNECIEATTTGMDLSADELRVLQETLMKCAI
ncbi:hypothetical protein PybrP1_012712 [[Pythium] brassicae (nom. inval.)]|nr:hypothetical protein PybrP1_012712 [[Pythium] brassicae (nom. inval.)]